MTLLLTTGASKLSAKCSLSLQLVSICNGKLPLTRLGYQTAYSCSRAQATKEGDGVVSVQCAIMTGDGARSSVGDRYACASSTMPPPTQPTTASSKPSLNCTAFSPPKTSHSRQNYFSPNNIFLNNMNVEDKEKLTAKRNFLFWKKKSCKYSENSHHTWGKKFCKSVQNIQNFPITWTICWSILLIHPPHVPTNYKVFILYSQTGYQIMMVTCSFYSQSMFVYKSLWLYRCKNPRFFLNIIFRN